MRSNLHSDDNTRSLLGLLITLVALSTKVESIILYHYIIISLHI
jgi:hypothetical protein